jgi:putative NAD(P)-binding protein
MARARPRVAIVGAGPAGAYAAACLRRSRGDVEIDLFERLATPWGLLRGGVAPDHQEIKRLQDTFDRQTLGRGCRFLGNVEIGVDVSHSELMRHYTAVVYATGAQTDKSLGIPGEDLPGSWAATEFVAWYNGHPDYRGLEFRPVGDAGRGDRQRKRGGGRDAHAHAEPARARAHRRGRPRPRGAAREPDRGGHRARPARSRAGGVHQRRAARAGPPRWSRDPGRWR